MPSLKNWNELYNYICECNKPNIILDTDMSNEVDDQFALTYLIKSINNFNLQAITIAPFYKSGYAQTNSIEDGTNLSYNTTLHLLQLLHYNEASKMVYKGATEYFKNCKDSNLASDKIIKIARKNNFTIILAIGAITNVAVAIYKAPDIIKKIKVVWLGGNSFLTEQNKEFNFRQDIEAVKFVFESLVNLVVIPCRNVASNLTTTTYEMDHYLLDKGELGLYLCNILKNCKMFFEKTETEKIGSRKTLWDLSVVAYVINRSWFRENQFDCPQILEDGKYKLVKNKHKITFVTDLNAHKIFQDFLIKMGC